jgi:signal transduction histidine kinase
MVTDLHLEAVRADYAKLQQQNEALKLSEARYRELAESLDRKVKEQLQVLDERQRQLYQAERLASIGQLAAGVAHEINNPLGFAASNLASASRYLERFAELKAACGEGEAAAAWARLDLDFILEDFAGLLAETTQGLERIANIVKDLKGFSSVDQPEEQVVDVNALLDSLCAVIAGQKPAGVELRKEFGDVPQILCLPGHLGQALHNLLGNAFRAVGEHGTVTVRTFRNGDFLRLQIVDDGCGMDAETLARAFDPFFTTRPVGQGTGLGLTVARDIVLAHSGRIYLESQPGAGSTVTIDLPA